MQHGFPTPPQSCQPSQCFVEIEEIAGRLGEAEGLVQIEAAPTAAVLLRFSREILSRSPPAPSPEGGGEGTRHRSGNREVISYPILITASLLHAHGRH